MNVKFENKNIDYFLKSNWSYPTEICFGLGRIRELFNICLEQGFQKTLLVTDKGLLSHSIVSEIRDDANKQNYLLEIFSDFDLNPSEKNIKDGVAFFKEGRFDSLIALGGGSALDCGKAIAFMVPQKLPIWEFEDVGDCWKNAQTEGLIPVIAVPTTSGTGSELGRASVILNETVQMKKIIFHPKMMPRVVLLDPELTFGLPPHLTASTGLDAFTHSLEAYLGPKFHPIADGIALESLRMVCENILVAYEDGQQVHARAQMQVAASMGAMAFQKGLGGIHAVSHSIGSIFKTHHGLTNAVVLPYVLLFNRPFIEDKVENISNYIQLKNTRFDTLIDFILDLRKKMKIPHTLKELSVNIDQSNSHTIAERSLNDPSASGNPRPLSLNDYQKIIENAYRGKL